jgi:hypothetical protein
LEKERRELYERSGEALHDLKLAFVEAVVEWRALLRRSGLLGGGGWDVPGLPEYVLPRPAVPVREEPEERLVLGRRIP